MSATLFGQSRFGFPATVFVALAIIAACTTARAQSAPQAEQIVVGAPQSAAERASAKAAMESAAKSPVIRGESIVIAAPKKRGSATSQRRRGSELPVGLTAVWRADSHKVERAFAWSIDAYSPDGELVGIADWSGIRIVRASNGEVLRRLPADSIRDTAYSLAVSSAGHIAVGRVGSVEFYAADSPATRRFQCPGICGPVGAVAFSPDGALLAYQATMGRLERQQGLGGVSIIATATGDLVTQLESLTARADLGFAADGRTLRATNANQLDDSERFGVRTWMTSDWRLQETLLGGRKVPRSVGRFGRTLMAAAIERDGNLEIHDVADDKVIWSAPLVPPSPSAEGNASSSTAMSLDVVEIAPNGRFVISYETPVPVGLHIDTTGTLVIRRAEHGEVVAMYDVPGVKAIAIAPDSKTFMYSTAVGQPYTVLARVPVE